MAVAVALTLAAATPAGAVAAAPTSLPVRASVAPAGQADLLAANGISVTLRARRATRVRVAVQLARGRARVTVSRGRLLRLRRGRRTALVRLTGRGREAIAACKPAAVLVTVRRGRATRRASTRMTPQPPACSRFFGAHSFWNTALADDAPLDPNSAAITQDLLRQVEQNYRSGQPPTVNTSQYSAPVYTVSSVQPTVRVQLDQPSGLDPMLEKTFADVPIPRGARPAAGSDGSMVVWQPGSDRLWEFWQARLADDGWHARWGGFLPDVSSGSGRFEAPKPNWGATATSLPLAGGLITPDELRRGRIDHALAVAIPEPRAGVYARPAQRTDGFSRRVQAVPEGARFRLDPAIDLAALNLPRPVRILSEAAQRYGMIVRDRGGVVALYAQDPVNLAADPYPALFGVGGAGQMLRSFPWWGLRLTRMDLVRVDGLAWSPCIILCD